MAKPKKKFYVVWSGLEPGIYTTWAEAEKQIKGYGQAKYKSFSSLAEAEAAFEEHWGKHVGVNKDAKSAFSGPKPTFDSFLHEIEANSIAVDAACSGNPGVMEYRGVVTLSPEQEIFHSPVFPEGTNNIGEFLAIVHALALYHEKRPDLTIYSDSKIAISWIKQKQCKTKLVHNPRTEKLLELVERGEKWLKTHKWKNPILKWETKRWGEIPADFGRK
ncbi:MAG: viroplasmin family protein [Bacteroidia bacterium]|nr:viroplasmin family protein [Bacteroidia bacterium]